MNVNDLSAAAVGVAIDAGEAADDDLLSPLLRGALQPQVPGAVASIPGVVVGELVALAGDGTTPYVRYPGQDNALPALTSIDLHGPHIGAALVLMFERGDPGRPVVVGVLRGQPGWSQSEPPAQVDVDADGQRLIVSAREQLVLRCGQASITLTQAGKVLIEGSYVLSRSSGVNRIQGGSIQLN
jgi:hypothetical protein